MVLLIVLAGLPILISPTSAQQNDSIARSFQSDISLITQVAGQAVCQSSEQLYSLYLLEHTTNESLKILNPRPQAAPTQLQIILRGTQQLESFPQAKAAFLRAAATWQSVIQTPIRIIIDVDFGPKFFGKPFPPLGNFTTLGLTSAQIVADRSGYSRIRDSLIANASSDQELLIYHMLPSESLPTDLGKTSAMSAPSALFRTLGILAPIADPDKETDLGPPPMIGFNSENSFDFDPSNGIDSKAYDFEGLALHEIGHVLGFRSNTGLQNAGPSQPPFISIWDLFRFRPGTTLNSFTTAPRILTVGGSQVFYVGNQELALSTGIYGGDGRQPSHWKDSVFVGNAIGVMDPIRNFGEFTPITQNDLLALDFFGHRLADFALNFDVTRLTLTRGESGQFNALINRNGGYLGKVTVTALNTKSLKIKLAKNGQTTSGTTIRFDLKIKTKAPLGIKQLLFTAQDEFGRQRIAKLEIEIQ
ncbi:MAG: NF038122 family metalloprotease [Acidobacteriota bacterium]